MYSVDVLKIPSVAMGPKTFSAYAPFLLFAIRLVMNGIAVVVKKT